MSSNFVCHERRTSRGKLRFHVQYHKIRCNGELFFHVKFVEAQQLHSSENSTIHKQVVSYTLSNDWCILWTLNTMWLHIFFWELSLYCLFQSCSKLFMVREDTELDFVRTRQGVPVSSYDRVNPGIPADLLQWGETIGKNLPFVLWSVNKTRKNTGSKNPTAVLVMTIFILSSTIIYSIRLFTFAS